MFPYVLTPPLYNTDLSLLTAEPKRVPPLWNLINTFGSTVWLLVLASLLAVCAAQHLQEDEKGGRKWALYGLLLGQGEEIKGRGDSYVLGQ